MAREEFIDSLRRADRMLKPPRVASDGGPHQETYYRSIVHSADFWLTSKSVEGFDPADFADWPENERNELNKEVSAFRAIAAQVPPNKPATKAQSREARKHLERV